MRARNDRCRSNTFNFRDCMVAATRQNLKKRMGGFMPSQTLKQYIQRTSDEELKNIDNMISAEMGRRSLKIQADLLSFDFDKISYFMNWSLFNEKQLSTILHNVIEELNRQKAKRQNVDVGFWDSDGNYKEDIQEINETDEWINNEGEE